MSQTQCTFFSRNKPYGKIDVWQISKQEKRVFFGYAPKKKGQNATSDHFLTTEDLASRYENIKRMERPGTGDKTKKNSNFSKQVSTNYNFVHGDPPGTVAVEEGSIAIIPRPEHASFYVGVVKGFCFNLNQASEWGRAFLRKNNPGKITEEDLRICAKEYGLGKPGDENVQAQVYEFPAELLQSWEVEDFHRLPYYALPRWMISSMMGRATLGRIANNADLGDDAGNPTKVMYRLIERVQKGGSLTNLVHLSSARDIDEIYERLVSQVSPVVFEHLCVSLLQILNPGDRWVHVGGSGDGGVDGLGFANDGGLVGRLQCKLFSGEKDIDALIRHALILSKEVDVQATTKYIIATLSRYPKHRLDGNIEVWDGNKIAQLVKDHAKSLFPLTYSLRIGVA